MTKNNSFHVHIVNGNYPTPVTDLLDRFPEAMWPERLLCNITLSGFFNFFIHPGSGR